MFYNQISQEKCLFGYIPPLSRYIHALTQNSSMPPGGRLNKKDGLTRYGDSHVKDKTS